MKIVLDTRVYLVINTTEYEDNPTAMVQNCKGLEDCENFGWRLDENYPCVQTHTEKLIGELEVGDMVMSPDYKGAYLMRVG
jgi:hypothetical protein